MATTGYSAAIDTNDLIMSYVAEATWGTTPATPAFTNIRLDSEGFSGSKSRTKPNEIDPAGQASASITTKEEATGSLNFSVSAGFATNELYASALNGVWTGAAGYSGEDFVLSSCSLTTRVATLTCAGAAFTTTNKLSVGQYIKVNTTASVFSGKVTAVTSATEIVLGDCRGYYANASAATGTITKVGVFMKETTIAVSAADGSARTCSITDSGNGFVDAGIVIGQFLKVYGDGSASATCSFVGRVLTCAAGTLTMDCVSNTAIATALAAAVGTCTIKGTMLRNGTTINTFTFQKKLAAALFLRYTGSFPTGGSFDVGTGDYLKGTMSFLCKSEASATSEIASATYVAAPTATVIDSVKGIGTVFRGVDTGTTPGAITALAGTTQKAGIKWTKEGAAAQYGMGSAAALGMRNGKITVTGSLSTYFLNFTLFSQYTNEQAGPLSWSALDGLSTAAATSGYVFTICNATIMNPKIVAGGPGQDVMADFEVEGNPDISSTSIFGGKTIQIDYFHG